MDCQSTALLKHARLMKENLGEKYERARDRVEVVKNVRGVTA